MADVAEELSYLHAATPNQGPRQRAKVIPFKLSEYGGVVKERRNVYFRIKPKSGKNRCSTIYCP